MQELIYIHTITVVIISVKCIATVTPAMIATVGIIARLFTSAIVTVTFIDIYIREPNVLRCVSIILLPVQLL